jgi:hypothetical protein
VRVAAFVAAALIALPALAEDAPRVAGTIELADGDILLEAKDGAARVPRAGGEVREGDTVTTFDHAELQLHMADGASIIVRENSKMTIAAYVADGGDEDRSLIELARGALRSITGWIGKYNRENYVIRTPLVTIGVRGTDHEPSHLLPGDPRGEAGSYDKVNDGAAFMQGAEGTIEVPKGRAVFRAPGRGARPRLLASVPAFYRPGRHERQFEARAFERRKELQQQRIKRREAVRRNHGAAGPRHERPEAHRERAEPRRETAAPRHERLERRRRRVE